ncbi:MAG: DUF4249 domain-containing protein [Runella sp.]
MKIFILLFSVILTFYACIPTKTYEIPFGESKLVLNAVLKANETPEIYVGKTWPATGAIPEATFMTDATATLWENDQQVGSFVHQKQGIYRIANYKIKPGQKYVIKVSKTGFQPAESAPVHIPNSFPLRSLSIDSNTNVSSSNSQWADPILLNVMLHDSPLSDVFLGVLAQTYTGGFLNATQISPIESNTNLTNASDCLLRSALFGEFELKPLIFKSQLFLYNPICIGTTNRRLGIILETKGYVQRPNDFSLQKADEIRVQLLVCSPEYAEFTKRNKILEGLDFAFNEPQPTYTNVKGGYGVVVAFNRMNRTLRL